MRRANITRKRSGDQLIEQQPEIGADQRRQGVRGNMKKTRR